LSFHLSFLGKTLNQLRFFIQQNCNFHPKITIPLVLPENFFITFHAENYFKSRDFRIFLYRFLISKKILKIFIKSIDLKVPLTLIL